MRRSTKLTMNHDKHLPVPENLRVVLILCVLALVVGCGHGSTTQVRLLIPDGYKGILVVLFNQRDGNSILEPDNSITLTFDINGVHKSSLAGWPGVRTESYFYVDHLGTQRRIMRYVRCRPNEETGHVALDTVGVCYVADGFVTDGIKFRSASYVVGPLGELAELEKKHEFKMAEVLSMLGPKP